MYVEAIKELHKKIELLKEKNTSLESTNNSLKNDIADIKSTLGLLIDQKVNLKNEQTED